MSLSTISNSESGSSARSKINAAFAAIDAGWSTGDIKYSILSTAPAGWVRLHGGGIGSAFSGATERANADVWPLFEALWNIGNGIEFVIPGGYGATAKADWDHNKPMMLPDRRGMVVAANTDTPGNPFITQVGNVVGAYEHTLIESELPVIGEHSHSSFAAGGAGGAAGSDFTATTDAGTAPTSGAGSFGGGLPHNNVQPTFTVGSILIKL